MVRCSIPGASVLLGSDQFLPDGKFPPDSSKIKPSKGNLGKLRILQSFLNFYQDRAQCKNANYLQNRVLLNKWALGMIRKLQKKEETETGKEAKSVKRIMAKLQSPSVLWKRWPR